VATGASRGELPDEPGVTALRVSPNGRLYTEMANAFAYRKQFNPSCSCKASGQTWAEALKQLSGRRERMSQDLTVVDVWEGRFDRFRVRRRTDPPCPTCGLRRFEHLAGDRREIARRRRHREPAALAAAREVEQIAELAFATAHERREDLDAAIDKMTGRPKFVRDAADVL
jgi:hypothetical protein